MAGSSALALDSGAMNIRTLRLAALFVALIALAAIGAATGLRDRFTVANLQAQIAASGPWGALLFGAAWCLGSLLYLPGIVFLVVATLAWGRVAGAGIGFLGAVAAVTLSFVLVRAVGGQALGESNRPWIRRVMARLDSHPIGSVFLLRLVLLTSPPINYSLALSSIRFRDHLIGSALGLAPPVVAVSLFTDGVMRLLGL
jgi:uncharacterized membrane protein YdjX (TVP38/TMEM64 family)